MAGLIRTAIVAALLLYPASAPAGAQANTPADPPRPAIELRDGDRIAFLGDSLFEREYGFGLIEAAISAAHPDKSLTFRNLGWSGDTVRGEARVYFGGPADGYAELLKSIDLVRPTVVFVAYGANESFDGDDALGAFVSDLGRLVGDLSSRTRRIVLLTPLPADRATSPLPSAALDARNRTLSRYAAAIDAFARERGLGHIDLYSAMSGVMSRAGQPALFEKGMFLTEAGYAAAAVHIAGCTGPTMPVEAKTMATDKLTELRALIVRKNDLFFHRWRPANVTYLYLFRQREQGKNAVEIPRFDPLVEAEEKKIADVRRSLAGGAVSGTAGGAR